MIKLTAKEDEIMAFFWEKGAMHVKELIELYPDPKPHFNTISTMVRALEAKGFLGHKNLAIHISTIL
jgi:Penicillinase repressor.